MNYDLLFFHSQVHFVHFNEKYETFEKAKDQEDGLAVLAVLVKVGWNYACMSDSGYALKSK